jgi:hypothetical protein
MLSISAAPLALVVSVPFSSGGAFAASTPPIPSQAQTIDQKTFMVLPTVLPPAQSNGTEVYPDYQPPRLKLYKMSLTLDVYPTSRSFLRAQQKTRFKTSRSIYTTTSFMLSSDQIPPLLLSPSLPKIPYFTRLLSGK